MKHHRDSIRQAVRNLVVGGSETTDFPECCLISHRGGGGALTQICSGVLVHPRVLLTAAHIGHAANAALLNVSNITQLAEAKLVAGTLTRHEAFRRDLTTHDIAVMILDEDSGIEPAAVASTTELQSANDVQLVGFGESNAAGEGFGIRRVAETVIRSLQRGRTPMSDDEQRFGFDSALEFVAGGDGRDMCNHDSGGPAYIPVAGRRKVAGVTKKTIKTAPGIAACGDGAVFTRVDVHLAFIREVAADAGIHVDF